MTWSFSICHTGQKPVWHKPKGWKTQTQGEGKPHSRNCKDQNRAWEVRKEREYTDVTLSQSVRTLVLGKKMWFDWSLCSIPFTGCLQNTCAVLEQVITPKQTESCVHCDSQPEVRFPLRCYLTLCKFKQGRIYASDSVPESCEWIETGVYAWECFSPGVFLPDDFPSFQVLYHQLTQSSRLLNQGTNPEHN